MERQENSYCVIYHHTADDNWYSPSEAKGWIPDSSAMPCPEAIISYNEFMGGVDRGDQLRGSTAAVRKIENFISIYFIFYSMLPLPTHLYCTSTTLPA